MPALGGRVGNHGARGKRRTCQTCCQCRSASEVLDAEDCPRRAESSISRPHAGGPGRASTCRRRRRPATVPELPAGGGRSADGPLRYCVRGLAADRKVRFTLKAFRELARLGMGLDEEDACDVLANLTLTDLVGRLFSEKTGEWMYVFKPSIGGIVVYVKVVLRADCVVISFHEEEESPQRADGIGGHAPSNDSRRAGDSRLSPTLRGVEVNGMVHPGGHAEISTSPLAPVSTASPRTPISHHGMRGPVGSKCSPSSRPETPTLSPCAVIRGWYVPD